MNYTEVTIECKNTDEVCDKLTAMGIDGFVIETEDDFKAFLENNRQYWDYVDESLEESYRGVSRVKFYVEDNDEGAALLGRVGEQFRITTAPVCDADWENNWKQYYEPLEIGERLLVVPEWIDCSEEGRVPLRLDPGLLFGTGSHATTRMCLAALVILVVQSRRPHRKEDLYVNRVRAQNHAPDEAASNEPQDKTV